MELTASLFAAVLVVSLFCQYLSLSLGAGYGTAVTPIFIIMGFSPVQVVPAVLLSQLAGGLVGGALHHRAGNIDLDFRRDENIKNRLRRLGYLPRSTDAKIVLVLVACGVIGVMIGAVTAVNIPTIVLETYIGVMVLGIGVNLLLPRKVQGTFSWTGIVALGLVSAFNKGVSGGGYVPLVAGGQILSGRGARNSVGSTAVAVAIVCAVGFLTYLLMEGDIYWRLAVATVIGSVVASPFAALTVRRVNTRRLTLAIGAATVILGILTLVRAFVL
ncbi:MAG: hypothetical protein DRI39_01405 [Chloroflexi bacterium]|nr:MAG: hypothetical protein DRI39_01405 [Chloroflexota bacterium]RLC97045.1 MAG: hypothetical protein DRI40_01380 [Chloroflexota bacterium]